MGIDERAWALAAIRARSGGREEMSALCALVWPSVRRWSLIELRDPALAEDAAQEALVRLIRHLSTWAQSRPFSSWLHAVVRNAARDVRSRQGEVREAEEAAALEPRLDRSIDLRRAAARALAAFDECTDRQRQILDLCDMQGLRPTEAAEILQIAPGTARALLHQARRTLRAALLRSSGSEVIALVAGRSHGV